MSFALNRHVVSNHSDSLLASRRGHILLTSKVLLDAIGQTRHVVAAFHDAVLILTGLLPHRNNFFFASHVESSGRLVLGDLLRASEGQVAMDARLIKVQGLASCINLSSLLLDSKLRAL